MKKILSYPFLSTITLTFLWLGACSKSSQSLAVPATGVSPTAAISNPQSDAVVAIVNQQNITLKDLEEKASTQLQELDNQRYQIRKQTLNQMVNEILMQHAAQKAGKPVEEYMRLEIEQKIKPVSEAEAKAFYEQNAAQLPPGAKFDEYRERILNYLHQQAQNGRAKELFEQLRQEFHVQITLPAPPKKRAAVDPLGPSTGPSSAKVTIVEFSDFQCPFCSRAKTVADEVLKKYQGKIRLVFRQFPLHFHDKAKVAAEAALCAHQQSKFWPYHDILFAEQSKLDVPDLKAVAKRLKLDTAAFDKCLDGHEQAHIVEQDLVAGQKAGVSGTPAFFINGILISGAQPIEEFSSIIDAELEAATHQ